MIKKWKKESISPLDRVNLGINSDGSKRQHNRAIERVLANADASLGGANNHASGNTDSRHASANAGGPNRTSAHNNGGR